MICRHYKNGEKLDVANLNELIVLIDRGETALTEVALNTWRAGLVGPPHSHEAKEQIFYITSGAGTVVVGEARYGVAPGSLVYVPAGVVHQTIAGPDAALDYLLINAFLDEHKEGHASYAEHVAIMKGIRKQQAETGQADVAGASGKTSANGTGKHLTVPAGDARQRSAVLLLKRSETSRSEVEWFIQRPDERALPVVSGEKERTVFMIGGSAQVAVAGETEQVATGAIVFVPAKAPFQVEANAQGASYLSFNTWLVPVAEPSSAKV
jgi:mannose-6-phosphate isomerase-like protein (cupin superfamily)